MNPTGKTNPNTEGSEKYETHHKVIIAIYTIAATDLSTHITDRLPDKAIDLIDEAASDQGDNWFPMKSMRLKGPQAGKQREAIRRDEDKARRMRYLPNWPNCVQER